MNPVIIETCKSTRPDSQKQFSWYEPPKWSPGPNFIHGHDPYYRQYVEVPIEQPVRVHLGKEKDGFFYYDESWHPIPELKFLGVPCFEVEDRLFKRRKDEKFKGGNRVQLVIIHLRVVRGSKMTTVWQETLYRGRNRDLPPHLRNAEQIHFARLREAKVGK